MDTQEQLNEVYRSLFDRQLIYERLGQSEATDTLLEQLNGPFLIATNDQYELSNPKVVIVGQENNNWFGRNSTFGEYIATNTLENAVSHYRDFDLERSHKKKTPFFQYFAHIREGIVGEVNESNRLSILWLNLFKLNHKGKSIDCPHSIVDAMLAIQEDVFQREIEMLRPDVVIFLTGPRYDKIIRRFYADADFLEVDGHPTREIATVKSKALPELSFRTYHPGYFNRIKSRKPYCYQAIIDRIRARYSAA